MKAFSRHRFGSPDLLRLDDLDKPAVTEEQALVRVHASSINAHDWHMLRGKPYLARLSEGFRAPKTREIGLDVAGVVEAVGSQVTHVKPGDRVFGSRFGAFAEYVSGKNMVPMPDGLSFEQAAAVPVAATTALQAVRDKGGIEPGHHVLVNGAGGGVGSFAVQIAKALGATVTGVCSTQNVELVRGIGADTVVDYTEDDFTSATARFDLIVDSVGNRPLGACRRALTPNGRYVSVGSATMGDWVGPLTHLLKVRLAGVGRSQTMSSMLATTKLADLEYLSGLLERGAVKPVVGRTYDLADVAEAITYVEGGHARGKVVIRI